MQKSLLTLFFSLLVFMPLSAQKKSASGKEPLFGSKQASYQIASNELKGACSIWYVGMEGLIPVQLVSIRGVSCMKMSMLMILFFVWEGSC